MTASAFMAKPWFSIVAKNVIIWTVFRTVHGNIVAGCHSCGHQIRLYQAQFRRMHACKDALDARGIEPVHALEKPCEHRAIVGQNRVIPVLKQVRLIDLDLFAEDAAAVDPTAHHPIDATGAVVGAAVAVLAEGGPEFGNHDDDGIAPSVRSDLLGKARERAAEL